MMDSTILFLLVCFLLACIHVLTTYSGYRRKSGNTARLPPGPNPFPIIGSIFKLGIKPHESLALLAERYGPLMSLKLGSRTTIVVSSPIVVKELVQKHDLAFSGRSVPSATYVMDHPKFSMVWLPTDNQWRKLRRLCKEQLFSSQRLDVSQEFRAKKVKQLVDYVHQCSSNGEAVGIGRVAFITTVNSLSNFIFSVDLASYNSDSSQEFKDTISKLLEVVGKPNLADFFPVLQAVDPQGLRRQTNFYASKVFAILVKIVNERLQTRASSGFETSRMNDVLDLVLDLTQKNDNEFSIDDILHLFQDMFVAGTDTMSSTVEWAMTELMHNPEKMAIARAEVKGTMNGKDDKTESLVQESDIPKLPYLQAVVKETLRLHPPVPLLVPHKAESDIEVQGYIVPKDAQILTNVWATGRDPSIWLNPDMFVPERFLNSEIDYKGQDFELIPFGAGRRICPGLPLARRLVHLMLGNLVCSFDWKLEGDMKAEEMDMSDRFGLTLQKLVPIKAIPIKI